MLANQVGEIKHWLSSQHIKVLPEWVEACIQWITEEYLNSKLGISQLKQLVYEQWQDSDLAEIATPCLPAGLSQAQKSILKGSFVLQINSIQDVGASAFSQLTKIQGKENENASVSATQISQNKFEPKPSRMLMMKVTDGHLSVEAMEYQLIPNLSTNTLPGTKILISGDIQCRLGVLMLTGAHVKVLGGEVEALIQENAQEKVLSRAVGAPEPTILANQGRPQNPAPRQLPGSDDDVMEVVEPHRLNQRNTTHTPHNSNHASHNSNHTPQNRGQNSQNAGQFAQNSRPTTQNSNFAKPLNKPTSGQFSNQNKNLRTSTSTNQVASIKNNVNRQQVIGSGRSGPLSAIQEVNRNKQFGGANESGRGFGRNGTSGSSLGTSSQMGRDNGSDVKWDDFDINGEDDGIDEMMLLEIERAEMENLEKKHQPTKIIDINEDDDGIDEMMLLEIEKAEMEKKHQPTKDPSPDPDWPSDDDFDEDMLQQIEDKLSDNIQNSSSLNILQNVSKPPQSDFSTNKSSGSKNQFHSVKNNDTFKSPFEPQSMGTLPKSNFSSSSKLPGSGKNKFVPVAPVISEQKGEPGFSSSSSDKTDLSRRTVLPESSDKSWLSEGSNRLSRNKLKLKKESVSGTDLSFQRANAEQQEEFSMQSTESNRQPTGNIKIETENTTTYDMETDRTDIKNCNERTFSSNKNSIMKQGSNFSPDTNSVISPLQNAAFPSDRGFQRGAKPGPAIALATVIVKDDTTGRDSKRRRLDSESDTGSTPSIPFTMMYLAEVSNDMDSSTEHFTFQIRAFIMTLLSGLDKKNDRWCLKVKINDGTAAVDMDLDDKILKDLIGFSVPEMKQMRNSMATTSEEVAQNTGARMKAGLARCQSSLVDLCGIMTIEMKPGYERPRVINIRDPNETDLQHMLTLAGYRS